MKSSKVHRRRGSILAAVGVATAIVAAGCSSGGNSGNASGSGPVTLTITGDYGGPSFDVTDNWWMQRRLPSRRHIPT